MASLSSCAESGIPSRTRSNLKLQDGNAPAKLDSSQRSKWKDPHHVESLTSIVGFVTSGFSLRLSLAQSSDHKLGLLKEDLTSWRKMNNELDQA